MDFKNIPVITQGPVKPMTEEEKKKFAELLEAVRKICEEDKIK